MFVSEYTVPQASWLRVSGKYCFGFPDLATLLAIGALGLQMQASMPSFVCVLGIQTQALMIAQQMFFPLNPLSFSLIFYLFVLFF